MTTDCAKCANSHDHINREARTRVSMCRVYNVPATPETAQGCTEFKPRDDIPHGEAHKLCICGMPWEPDMDQFGCWSCGATHPGEVP